MTRRDARRFVVTAGRVQPHLAVSHGRLLLVGSLVLVAPEAAPNALARRDRAPAAGVPPGTARQQVVALDRVDLSPRDTVIAGAVCTAAQPSRHSYMAS